MKIKRIGTHDLAVPSMQTPGAAGYDLQARLLLPVEIHPGKRAFIPCGFAFEICSGPAGQLVGMVCSRSGLALKHGIIVLNAPGIIDSDYRGEVGAVLQNLGDESFTISHGDRIAQLVLVMSMSVPLELVESLSDTDRGTAGFGSTGVRERDS